MGTRTIESAPTGIVQPADGWLINASVNWNPIQLQTWVDWVLTFTQENLIAAMDALQQPSLRQPNTNQAIVGLSSEQIERAEWLEIGRVRTKKLWWLAEGAYATILRINDPYLIRDIVLLWQKRITDIRKMKDEDKPVNFSISNGNIADLLKYILPHWHTLNAQFRHETYKYFYDINKWCEPDDITIVMVYLHCLCVISNNKVLTPSKLLNKVVSILTWWTLAYDSRDTKAWTYKSTGVIPDKDRIIRIYEKVHANQWDYERTVIKSPYFVQLTRVIPIEDPKNIPEQHIQWLQEIIILGGTALQIIPYPALARLFVSRHRAYLRKHQYLIPESWWLDDDLIQTLLYPPKPEDTPKPKRNSNPKNTPNTPFYTNIPTTLIDTAKPLVAPLEGPKISQEEMIRLENSYKFKPFAHKFVPNFPSHAVLWIGIVPVDTPDDHIQWTKYRQYDRVELAKPKESTQYIFAFGLATDDAWIPPIDTPRTTETIEIKKEPPKDPPQTPDEVTDWVQKSTKKIVPTTPESPKAPVNNPADNLTIDLLVQLDETNPTYQISSDDKGMTLTFTWDSGIQARYHRETKTIILSGWDEDLHSKIIMDIWVELRSVFEQEFAKQEMEKQKMEAEKKTSILTKLSIPQTTLNTIFADIDISDIVSDLVGLLVASRRNGCSTAGLFAQKQHISIWNEFQERCKTDGIYVNLSRTEDRKETIITVSLCWEAGISGNIQTHNIGTIPTDRKTTLEQLTQVQFDPKLVDTDIQSALSQVLLSVLTTLSLAANSILHSELDKTSSWVSKKQKTTNGNASFHDDMTLSLDNIRDILAGNPPRQRKSWERLSNEQKTSIQHAIKRLDDGRGRQLIIGGFDHTNGYYSCQVQSRKSWTDLWDTDRVIIYDEKISSVPQWEKWNPHIHDMIRVSERHPKYLILKMVATIQKKPFRGKRPFTNGIKDYFSDFWGTITDIKKAEFLQAVTLDWSGKAGNGLKILLEDGSSLFETFRQWLEQRKTEIQLRYIRPQSISISDIKEFQKEIWQIATNLPEEIED